MKQYVAVLPGGITHEGKLPFFVTERLNYAYKYFYAKNPEKIIVCGKWSHLVPQDPPSTEAAAMHRYITSLGVSSTYIVSEEYSNDLISCLYSIRTRILKPNITHIHLVTNEYQSERVAYVGKKIFAPQYVVSLKSIQNDLTADTLWEFYTYEQRALAASKTFLYRMKPGDIPYLSKKLESHSSFYSESDIGYTRLLVYENRIGKKTNTIPHYALSRIEKEKKRISVKYHLIDKKRKKSINSDFWAGRFLNFHTKDIHDTYYQLKFVLQPKDKESFIKEIRITDKLQKSGATFIPEVIDKCTDRAPIWYLYRIVYGVPSGTFAGDLSFKDSFFKPWVIGKIVRHLAFLRSIDTSSLRLPAWNGNSYKRTVKKMTSLSSQHYVSASVIHKAITYLYAELSLFDTVPSVTSHCDLHPSNIILSSKEKNIYLIDFEHASLNTIAFDFAFLYVFSWPDPAFQKKLMQEFVDSLTADERDIFTMVFPATYCFLLLWLLDKMHQWKYRLNREKYILARNYVRKQLLLFNRKGLLSSYTHPPVVPVSNI